MTTAAIYARVSSARQKEEQTIGSQTAALREAAGRWGLDVPAEWIFEDEGSSRANLVRPALERLQSASRMARLVSSPIRSSSANGPIGNPHPPFIASSMSLLGEPRRSPRPDRVVEVREEQGVDDEPGPILHLDRLLAALFGEGTARIHRRLRHSEWSEKFNKSHHRCGIEEVHAAHLLGPTIVRSEQTRSNSVNTCRLAAMSSTIDSIIRSQSTSSPRSQVTRTRSSARWLFTAQSPLLNLFGEPCSSPASMASGAAYCRLRRTTSCPVVSATSAIPDP
jgi:Resolvase, N terminal domain